MIDQWHRCYNESWDQEIVEEAFSHQAMLVENHGTKTSLMGVDEEINTERKSFFRRLAEKKGSPRIDFEDVICLRKKG